MTMRMASVAAICGALALSACGGGGNNEAANAGGATTTSTTSTTAAAAPGATMPGMTTTASTGAALPAACEAYVQRVQACVNRAGPNNPAATAMQQNLEQMRASWSTVPDQTALANVCTQADAQMTQMSAAMGC